MCVCLCVCDPVIILVFKFLKVITGSIQVHKHRTDARYLLNDTILYQNKHCNKKKSPVIRRIRNKTFFKVPIDIIVEFPYYLHFSYNLLLVSFYETCVLGENLLYFLRRES